MNDKELFELFKAKSAGFDETPSDELWQKIRRKSVRRPWFRPQSSRLFLIVLLLLVIVIVAVCMTIFFFERHS
ncbi:MULTISPECIES: hypothetical protein [unclassified Flavobacterium]|uniref:hypothetical protein n=1 Tax=unclassified Flavobacterium TaxID=196869 RepID=UPI001F14367B|nr:MULTISPECIES: hypothetical protein [unclassified Flavobacterium]UMY66716.1 hypothetical protein MKO97_04845 [Flavobacterium sp. HJ-32-4]